jgi:hypothetical protein
LRSLRQVKRAQGFLHGGLLPDLIPAKGDWTFWTMTAWDSQESMRGYMMTGDHKTAMLHLMEWCDEASVAHWEQEDSLLPTWEEADKRMRASGRASKVRWPSAEHAVLGFREPRTKLGAVIRRA